MIVKTVFMLGLFFIPLIILNSGIVSSPLVLFILYIISGLGMAGIGMGVMHDAIHGSYSKNGKINKYLGYTMNLIGANATVWRIQHNVLHHTYTNIHEADDDINLPFILRFSPHAKKYWWHRFQHVYIWFFYGISTITWVTAKDFIRLHRYRKMGFFDEKNEFQKETMKIIGWKVLYYSYTLVLPIIMISLAPWTIILAFITMHIITGLCLSLVFQTAHIIRSTEFPLPDQHGVLENDWWKHQLVTTSNYAPGSTFFSWLIGGLNFQIEHHLLPHICHIHYRKLSPIVAQTAKEFGITYHTKKTFAAAILDHLIMLRELGKME